MPTSALSVLAEILAMGLTVAPWLFLGLVTAGLVKAFVSEHALRRWVGGRGVGGISRAALIGAPVPLCSCGAIPTAVTLHRGGANRGPTTAFLIGAPGVGVDSVALTYALLGPLMMLLRVAGAVTTAVATGLLVATTQTHSRVRDGAGADNGSCGTGGCCDEQPACDNGPATDASRLGYGMRYAFDELYGEIGPWMVGGLALAGAVAATISPQALAYYGSGPMAVLVMAVVGMPLYICATAATPVAAAMLVGGVSPGAVMTFLLAGPVTSLATLAVLRREMGGCVLTLYLLGVMGCTVAIGMTVNALMPGAGIDIAGRIRDSQALLPDGLSVSALVVLLALGIRPLRRRALAWLPA